MEEVHRLFVYGTLLTGLENQFAHYLQNHSKYVGKGYFFGHLYDVGHYPGAIYDPESEEKVEGDIILLNNDKEILSVLDAYEGVGSTHPQPNEYRREIIVVYHGEQPLHCWTYLYNHPVQYLIKIHPGNYIRYLHDRQK